MKFKLIFSVASSLAISPIMIKRIVQKNSISIQADELSKLDQTTVRNILHPF